MTCKIGENGTKIYFNQLEQVHREDGPAIEWSNKDKEWWVNDKRHRWNSPALIITDLGINVWMLFGIKVTEKYYRKWLKENGMNIDNLTVEDKLLIRMKFGS